MRILTVLALLASATFGFAADTPPAKDPNAGAILDPLTYEVWSTEQGSKYHTKDCPSAKVKVTLAKALADEDTPCKQCSPPVYDPAKIVVFTGGEGGKKYHLFSCRYAKEASTLAKVVADGLEACGTCKPPVVWKLPAAATPAPATAAAPAPAPVPAPTPAPKAK